MILLGYASKSEGENIKRVEFVGEPYISYDRKAPGQSRRGKI